MEGRKARFGLDLDGVVFRALPPLDQIGGSHKKREVGQPNPVLDYCLGLLTSLYHARFGPIDGAREAIAELAEVGGEVGFGLCVITGRGQRLRGLTLKQLGGLNVLGSIIDPGEVYLKPSGINPIDWKVRQATELGICGFADDSPWVIKAMERELADEVGLYVVASGVWGLLSGWVLGSGSRVDRVAGLRQIPSRLKSRRRGRA